MSLSSSSTIAQHFETVKVYWNQSNYLRLVCLVHLERIRPLLSSKEKEAATLIQAKLTKLDAPKWVLKVYVATRKLYTDATDRAWWNEQIARMTCLRNPMSAIPANFYFSAMRAVHSQFDALEIGKRSPAERRDLYRRTCLEGRKLPDVLKILGGSSTDSAEQTGSSADESQSSQDESDEEDARSDPTPSAEDDTAMDEGGEDRPAVESAAIASVHPASVRRTARHSVKRARDESQEPTLPPGGRSRQAKKSKVRRVPAEEESEATEEESVREELRPAVAIGSSSSDLVHRLTLLEEDYESEVSWPFRPHVRQALQKHPLVIVSPSFYDAQAFTNSIHPHALHMENFQGHHLNSLRPFAPTAAFVASPYVGPVEHRRETTQEETFALIEKQRSGQSLSPEERRTFCDRPYVNNMAWSQTKEGGKEAEAEADGFVDTLIDPTRCPASLQMASFCEHQDSLLRLAREVQWEGGETEFMFIKRGFASFNLHIEQEVHNFYHHQVHGHSIWIVIHPKHADDLAKLIAEPILSEYAAAAGHPSTPTTCRCSLASH